MSSAEPIARQGSDPHRNAAEKVPLLARDSATPSLVLATEASPKALRNFFYVDSDSRPREGGVHRPN